MKYNFDEPVKRWQSGCYKWDSLPSEEVLPMWVADMEFRTAPAIIEALHRRVEHGVFGYTWVPEPYYQAVMNWFSQRHHWQLEREWMLYTTGVVPALSACIKAFTEPGDEVILQTPAYNCFFSSIRNNGCLLADNRLLYKDGTYTIDFENLEALAARPRAKVMILCSPHNPSGRVWSREELERIGEICLQHNLTIIADEIHCEFVAPGFEYIPFASLSPELLQASVTLTSPSKAFNIAGLQAANIFVADPQKRAAIDKAMNCNEVVEVSPFAVAGVMSAYNESGDWLDELNAYIHSNFVYLRDALARELPGFTVLPLEGTYLVWLDCSQVGLSSKEMAKRLLEEQKLKINEGTMYGEDGEGFLRINIACPRSYVERCVKALSLGIKTMLKS